MLGEITNIEGSKVDAVTDKKSIEDGVITEVEASVESGKVGSQLRLTVFIYGIFIVIWQRQRSRRHMEGTRSLSI
jgi:hypothetical protein